METPAAIQRLKDQAKNVRLVTSCGDQSD